MGILAAGHRGDHGQVYDAEIEADFHFLACIGANFVGVIGFISQLVGNVTYVQTRRPTLPIRPFLCRHAVIS